jgi:DNA-binding IclR family transcriptional regulator
MDRLAPLQGGRALDKTSKRSTEPAPAASDASEVSYISPPIQRAARLLRHIAEGDAVTNLARTSREIGINRTTLLRLLSTLEAEKFIEPLPHGQPGWRIGIGLIGIAAQSFFSEDLVQVSVPVLTRLTEQIRLSTHLGVLDGREIVYLVRRVPNHSFASNIRVGSRLPAHAVTMGRIILAHMPTEAVDRLFGSAPLPASTDRTVRTLRALHEKIRHDRALGVAWSDGLYEQNISSVAAAIFDASGAPAAAINVSGQTDAFGNASRRKSIETDLIDAAREISLRIGWHGPHSAALLKPRKSARVASES